MIDFKDFVKQFKRMCNTYNNECSKCPLSDHRGIFLCFRWCFEDPEKAEQLIMDWVKKHPPVTNRDKFKEVFGCDIVEKLLLDFPSRLAAHEWLEKEYVESKNKEDQNG